MSTDTEDFGQPRLDGSLVEGDLVTVHRIDADGRPRKGQVSIATLGDVVGASPGGGGITEQEAIDAVQPTIIEGVGIDINIVSGNVVIDNTAPYTAEAVRDDVAAMLLAGTHTNITVTPNDGANSMSLAATYVAPATNVGYTAATRVVTSSTGTGFTLPLVSGSDPGLISAANNTLIGTNSTAITANGVAIAALQATDAATALDIADIEDRLDVLEGTTEPPPEVSDLANINFDGGGAGDIITTTTTTGFSSMSGSGTLTHQPYGQVEGGMAMQISGSDSHYGRVENATHTNHFISTYYTGESPASETTWHIYVWEADGTTVAYRIGVNSSNQFVIQVGTAGGTDIANFVITTGQLYKLECTSQVGASATRLAIYTGSAINNTGEVGASDVIAVTRTAAQISDEALGLINTITSGGVIVVGNLVIEDCEGTSGTAPTAANSTWSNQSGSGSLTYSNTWSHDGSTSIKINGSTTHQGWWDLASHVTQFARMRVYFDDAPTGGTLYLYQARNGGNTATAFQIGITTAGLPFIRRGISGTTGANTAGQGTALTTLTEYDFCWTANGAGSLTLDIFLGSAIDADPDAAAAQTITFSQPLVETDFGRAVIGVMSTISGATTPPLVYVDNIRIDNTAMPSPTSETGGSDVVSHFDRYKSSAIAMPAGHTIFVGGVSDKLIPPPGTSWWGAACPPDGSSTTTPASLASFETLIGRQLDVIHMFKTAFNWDGRLTTNERTMATQTGRTTNPRLFMFNWKVCGIGGSRISFAAVAAGQRDAQIAAWAQGIDEWGELLWVTLEHEPENEGNLNSTGWTRNDYADMWRHVVTVARANGATKVIWAWTMMGYSSHAGTNGQNYNSLWPGDDVVDWIAWDPYWQSTARIDFAEGLSGGGSPRSLINENVNGTSGWNGFEAWAQVAKTVGGSGVSTNLRYAFAGTKPLMIAEFGVWFTTYPPTGATDGGADIVDAGGATRFTSIGEQHPDHTRIQCMLYYNDMPAHLNKLGGHTASIAAFNAVGARTEFNVGTENVP